jgi:hypothetical protein
MTPPTKPARARKRAGKRTPARSRTATFVDAEDCTTRVRLDDGQTFPLGTPVPVDAKTAQQLAQLAGLSFEFDPPLPKTPSPPAPERPGEPAPDSTGDPTP